jgi:hypothetical protein
MPTVDAARWVFPDVMIIIATHADIQSIAYITSKVLMLSTYMCIEHFEGVRIDNRLAESFPNHAPQVASVGLLLQTPKRLEKMQAE